MKSQNTDIGVFDIQISVIFGMQLSSNAAELHVKFHIDLNIQNTNHKFKDFVKFTIKRFIE